MNFKNTYSDLAELMQIIFNKENIFLSYDHKFHLDNLCVNFNDEIRFLIGSTFFDINPLEALNLFRTNRYFIDAIGIKLLPSLVSIEKINEKKINDQHINIFLKEIIRIITVDNKYYIEEFAN